MCSTWLRIQLYGYYVSKLFWVYFYISFWPLILWLTAGCTTWTIGDHFFLICFGTELLVSRIRLTTTFFPVVFDLLSSAVWFVRPEIEKVDLIFFSKIQGESNTKRQLFTSYHIGSKHSTIRLYLNFKTCLTQIQQTNVRIMREIKTSLPSGTNILCTWSLPKSPKIRI